MTKRNAILLLAAVGLLIGMNGCKQEEWIDWKVLNEAWLEQNAKQDGVVVTHSGLQYKVIRQGIATAGPKPDDLKTVVISYEGRLINSMVFDQNESTALQMSNLISGMQEGLKKMNLTGHYIFYIPYNLGYKEDGSGTEGYSNFIPPYSTLIFDVTLEQCY